MSVCRELTNAAQTLESVVDESNSCNSNVTVNVDKALEYLQYSLELLRKQRKSCKISKKTYKSVSDDIKKAISYLEHVLKRISEAECKNKSYIKRALCLISQAKKCLDCKCEVDGPCHQDQTYDNSCIIYVNIKAAPGGDGLSWATAFQQLQDALDLAAVNGGANEIWVAEGTYKPTAVPLPIEIFGGKPSWDIRNSSISIYGGFRGKETRRSDRILNEHHLTILSGDIDNNDAPPVSVNLPHDDPNGFWQLPEAYLATKRDNSRHLFLVVNSNITLDGLYLTKGWASDDLPFVNPDNYQDYVFCRQGGGIIGQTSDITLRNITFDDCSCYGAFDLAVGGAIRAVNCSILMECVDIKNCFSSDFGAGFLIQNGDIGEGPSSFSKYSTIMNKVTVSNNRAHGCVNSFEDHGFSMSDCLLKDSYSMVACGNLQVLASDAQNAWSNLIENCVFNNNEGGWCAALDCINDTVGVDPSVKDLPTGLMRVLNSKFLNNRALYAVNSDIVVCGAICNFSWKMNIENNTFDENTGLSCGAICCTPRNYINPLPSKDVYVTIRSNVFSRNRQLNGTGAFRVEGGTVHFGIRNKAAYGPYPVVIPSNYGEITDNKFYRNVADGNGGALLLDGFEGTVKNNKFDNDTAVIGTEVYLLEADTNDIVDCNKFVAPVTPNTVVTGVVPSVIKVAAKTESLKSKSSVGRYSTGRANSVKLEDLKL